ncbi:hydrogenase maturation protease [Mycolicibacterium duvalii]|uniref:Peptidase M52 n=1 Tax=Mycolicibacterium duvalii TaxID=39688 RepID=A0A7I7K9Q3_9MYCO|nr:hydrogenase maturation protease [Mycolicibacterium duvalii]MCV7366462.1 hydrogenase maturation protease [Mycolicibacterium duvalii]BBX20289.1 peptidase M52 [Mycolicibacterium duvalii]
MTDPRAVVIGIGNRFRSDDAIGPVVAARLEELALPGVLVTVCDGEPAGLLDTWAGVDLAVIIDAVRCEPATPGRIWRTTIDEVCGLPSATSSHAVGIPEAVRLGQALGRVPAELVVIAVEADSLVLGDGLSGPVAAAAPEVLRTVLRELSRVGVG